MAKKLSPKKKKVKATKKPKLNLKKLTQPHLIISTSGTTGAETMKTLFKTPEQMFKEALFQVAEWQENATQEEKATSTYHELRVKAVNRTFESFKHILKKKIK